ncbi:ubiquitin conjugating enzyme [Penicillium chrysogenum]|uniref:ubiquitin conjugating enzyme n=1 Tax=Penicillium chrysogenum TaxID=5076 RepID=UPI0023A3298F|nr:ubiquitin conjugating enzyme [Penicillium chrysogenum]KAJ5245678.1 ubiquitin conjugating enzyme [Penicillium chrysogenum]KAJ5259752.1 ubiquitin conjugating enzyme [Penicillium chrysogenum]
MASRTRGIDTRQRLMKELKAYNKEGENETFLYLRPVNDEDLLHWEAVLKGPAASPYEGGLWGLDIQIPSDYPYAPPTIHFTTKIAHPNIAWSTGEICSSLNNDWKPTVNLSGILAAIQLLLTVPDPDSPLNPDIAVLMRNGDLAGWESVVRYWTEEERWQGVRW